MIKILPNVTLVGIDCVDIERLILAADISTKEISFGAVKLLSSIPSSDKRVINIGPIRSKEQYSDFVIKKLNQYIDTDFALVFQYDGFILNPSAWSDDFLKYDYIGAPWYHLGRLHVGNGGFSLRSKKLINWLATNWSKIDGSISPEDVFISKFARPYIQKEDMVFAPEDVAAKFSKEGNEHSVVWNGEFGFHGINYTDISNWLKLHPEYKEKLTYELDDYTTLMKKYPVYDGTVHTLRFKKHNMKDYREMASNNKNYEIRLTKEKHSDLSNIKIGDTIVFKRSGVSFKDVSVPAFERKIKKIEKFNSLENVRMVYPNLHITYPLSLPKWERPIAGLLGNFVYPKDESYTIFWFN